ncbi:MAG TPA: M56 family metallopeptidase [Thermoanaerobaculia bacterium]|nr:M56 family metallopeptidase [Thermoanaerobaculia bacterium]
MSILLIAKLTLLFGGALLSMLLARAAATRHALLAGAQLAALIVPFLTITLPPIRVIPAHRPPALATPSIERPSPRVRGEGAQRADEGPNVLAILYLTGLTLILATKATAYARAFLITRRANGMFSADINQPATFGNRILLPLSAKQWSEEKLRIVLLHEQAHVARRDTLHGILSDVTCAVYWFHPLAWLVAARAGLERERACDDRVLAAGIAPGDYAAAMLDVARAMTRGHAATMPMAEVSHIERRIRAILDPTTRRRSAHALAALACVVAAAPLLAALGDAFPRPRAIEPDLLGNWTASPYSERVEPPAPLTYVDPAGPDAALIALLDDSAARPPRHDIDFVPERSRWALTQVRNGELVPSLLELLQDNDWRIRAYAAWALGHADSRATLPLTALLDESNWRVRAMAAHALANLGDRAAEQAMLDHLGDDAWQVRVEVVHYLKAIGGHRADIAAMRSDRHMAVRGAAEE